MHPGYEDVTSRIEEDPTWYTVEGFPRYGEFKPKECNIYADYSVLMEIECQSCAKQMLIGADYCKSDMLQFKIDKSRLTEDELKWSKGDEIWLPIRDGLFAPHALDENGAQIYRTTTLEELVNGWGYGDPPNHGCIGDTMGAVERKSVEVWDLHFGRIVVDSEGNPSNNGGVIKYWGDPKRIEELEGIDLTPDWVHE